MPALRRVRPKATAVMVGAVVAAVIGVAAVVGLWSSDQDRPSGRPPADIEPAHSRVVAPKTLGDLAEFSFAYKARTAADAAALRPSLGLTVVRDETPLYSLVAKVGGSPAIVRRAGELVGVPSVELRGERTLTFRLPDLDSGFYRLCGKIGFDAVGSGGLRQEEFCHTIEVVD